MGKKLLTGLMIPALTPVAAWAQESPEPAEAEPQVTQDAAEPTKDEPDDEPSLPADSSTPQPDVAVEPQSPPVAAVPLVAEPAAPQEIQFDGLPAPGNRDAESSAVKPSMVTVSVGGVFARLVDWYYLPRYLNGPGIRSGVDIGVGWRGYIKGRQEQTGRDVRVYFAPELHYSQFGARFTSSSGVGSLTVGIDVDQITAPILFRVDLRDLGGFRPTVHFGPQVGFKIRKMLSLSGTYGTYTYTYSRDFSRYGSYYANNTRDAGITMGAGVTIPLARDAEARVTLRYYQGMLREGALGGESGPKYTQIGLNLAAGF